MNNDSLWLGIVGFIFGLCVMGLLTRYIGTNPQIETINKREACELNIPRNQHCVMQFIPAIKDSK